MKPVIFCGPTLWSDGLLAARDLDFLPPAQMGDVYRAAISRPPAIGIIDGRFEICPSIWHKEILWALSQGIHVFGAASIGALRAVELAPFGMRGIGKVYRDFRRKILTDDDEVVVVHAPKDHFYRPLSEALVDIRATLDLAVARRVVSRALANEIVGHAKATFFKERQWNRILGMARKRRNGRELAKLSSWIAGNHVHLKQEDAHAMVRAIRRLVASNPLPFRARFSFQNTVYWQSVVDAETARRSRIRRKRR